MHWGNRFHSQLFSLLDLWITGRLWWGWQVFVLVKFTAEYSTSTPRIQATCMNGMNGILNSCCRMGDPLINKHFPDLFWQAHNFAFVLPLILIVVYYMENFWSASSWVKEICQALTSCLLATRYCTVVFHPKRSTSQNVCTSDCFYNNNKMAETYLFIQ